MRKFSFRGLLEGISIRRLIKFIEFFGKLAAGNSLGRVVVVGTFQEFDAFKQIDVERLCVYGLDGTYLMASF